MKTRIYLKVLLFVLIVMSATALCGCFSDVIIMSPEEEAQWMEDQTVLFSDVVLSDFDVKSLDGQTVTAQDCFGDYKLTMVNIWGVFCGPCIDEMPEISALYNSRPEGVNIISICTDAEESNEYMSFAKEVMESSKAGFVTLIPDDTLADLLTDRVTSFPTTIFVNSNGNVVGAPYFGAQDKAGYLEAISERLELLDSEQAAANDLQP